MTTRTKLAFISDRPNASRLSPTLRRSLLTAAVVLIAGVLAPTIPATAGSDPTAFINNLGNQFQIVARNPAAEQRLAGFRQLFREDFDVPGLGRFVLGRFVRVLNPLEQQEFLGLSRLTSYTRTVTDWRNSPPTAASSG